MTASPRCLALDLEVGADAGRIERIGALRPDTGERLVHSGGDLSEALTALDRLADGAAFVLGHNIIAFDLPHLDAVRPDLALLKLPAVDTLRLNPLAFPRNPYHHLVKHYQDGQLKGGRTNDPLRDAMLALEVFADQRAAFADLHDTAPDLLVAWHWLTTGDGAGSGVDKVFATSRRSLRPSAAEASAAMRRLVSGRACATQVATILETSGDQGWPLAYALAWLSVAGGNSVMPPWVGHQFPKAGELVIRLRDTACSAPDCVWCGEHHDATKELQRAFGPMTFRPEPADAQGRPLQRRIVEAALARRHALGILPTGTGKSLCYQVPALSRYDKTGALTVVISPLVALMADQVVGLEARGVTSAAALNGLLSMPERADVLERLRMGGIGILLVSPEQLRNRSFRKALAQRDVGLWVLDEAHCVSKWGHDFRPDYRYVARFIRERAGDRPLPPVLCLTATAKPEVVADITDYFSSKLGISLDVFDGGANRTNLVFAVVPTTTPEKFAHVHQILVADLPAGLAGGAIVYSASRRRTEEIAQFLTEKGISSGYFHAGMAPEAKKEAQKSFLAGELRVICATNAFGMGIDKPDVRLVIHADIPGSLENYLQEAGRAGRDRDVAKCVLLYTPEDVERQFGMTARSRLSQSEIQAILRSLRRLDTKKRTGGEVVATAGEILLEDGEHEFARDSATDDTRVRTALAWLEEAELLMREENEVQVFPSSLQVGTLAEARECLERAGVRDPYRAQLLKIVAALIDAPATEGISTDELMGVAGLSSQHVRNALHDLDRLGVARNDTALTAFVHAGVAASSKKRLEAATALENDLIDLMREEAPELQPGEASTLHLRNAAQRLRDRGHPQALPVVVLRLARGLSGDGRAEDGGMGVGSVSIRRLDPESVRVTLHRSWLILQATAQLRHEAASLLLGHLLACLPDAMRGTDLLAKTTLGDLLGAITSDLTLTARVRDPQKLHDRALLWLHEQEVIRLNKGLAVFRAAMTLRLGRDRRSFAKADFEPLKLHYDEQVVQIHVMAEYAQRGLQTMADAIRLAMDYFALDQAAFLERWMAGRDKDLTRQTTPASYRAIVESLRSPAQQRIVVDDRETTNVLVLAGPGSGKTRVLVHRIAYLVRVKRENPRGILALAYNRHAAVEIRRRLAALLGDDANGITVLTCHAMAMRLVGASFERRAPEASDAMFRQILAQAVDLLKGTGLAPEDADEQRDRLLAGFRWILVDEYQDIGPEQYELIAAIAGRTRTDEEGRLRLFAVGDDDQNLYSFQGASVEYIRRFEADYGAKPSFLTENYRSTGHIIAAANAVIGPARDRMKSEHPIIIDRSRQKMPGGGGWQSIDPVGQGRVQLLPAGKGPEWQAVAAMTELERLAALAADWSWSRCAVIARDWKYLDPVRTWCELHNVPVQMANESAAHFWRLRETQTLVDWLRSLPARIVSAEAMRGWLAGRPSGRWWSLLREAVDAYTLEAGLAEAPVDHVLAWLAEWGREIRRAQSGLLLLTAHRAKGLEFDHVIVLDGAWNRRSDNEDADSPRRLFYVAMTRARKTLGVMTFRSDHPFASLVAASDVAMERDAPYLSEPSRDLGRRYDVLDQGEVDLGFAGRKAAGSPVHRAIARLEEGSTLRLEARDGKPDLLDGDGFTVGRLAGAYVPPQGTRCVSARVGCVLVRFRSDSDPKYAHLVQADRWEVVVPELVFEPAE